MVSSRHVQRSKGRISTHLDTPLIGRMRAEKVDGGGTAQATSFLALGHARPHPTQPRTASGHLQLTRLVEGNNSPG
jgi:hypothetical protein